MIKFEIPGRLPGMNEYTKACRTHYAVGYKMKRNEQENIEWILRLDKLNKPLKEPVQIEYIYYEKNKKRDFDNISSFAHKVIQDALVSQGVLTNDGWKSIKGFKDSFYVSAKNPRIEVKIFEYGEHLI